MKGFTVIHFTYELKTFQRTDIEEWSIRIPLPRHLCGTSPRSPRKGDSIPAELQNTPLSSNVGIAAAEEGELQVTEQREEFVDVYLTLWDFAG